VCSTSIKSCLSACASVAGLLWPHSLRPFEKSIGHQWEADWCLCCGSVSGVVNAASYLWWVSLGPGEGSTRAVPFRAGHSFFFQNRFGFSVLKNFGSVDTRN
jgi:hypothetical protein